MLLLPSIPDICSFLLDYVLVSPFSPSCYMYFNCAWLQFWRSFSLMQVFQWRRAQNHDVYSLAKKSCRLSSQYKTLLIWAGSASLFKEKEIIIATDIQISLLVNSFVPMAAGCWSNHVSIVYSWGALLNFERG